MSVELVIFIVMGVIAIVSAAAMLLSKNAVYSAVFLILNFAVVAVFYLMLGAPFIAMVQVTVYAGAIMVLFVFVVMLLGAERLQGRSSASPGYRVLAVVLTIALIGVAVYGLITASIPMNAAQVADPAAYGGPEQIGIELFTSYMFPFQTVAFLLLVAMIGAVVLTRDEIPKVDVREVSRERRIQQAEDILTRQLSTPEPSGQPAPEPMLADTVEAPEAASAEAEPSAELIVELEEEGSAGPEPSTPEISAQVGDDLTIIEGIGPKSATVLNAAGIFTFADLAGSTADKLREILDEGGLPKVVDPTTWPEQATLLSRGDWAAFEKLKDELKGGRRVS